MEEKYLFSEKEINKFENYTCLGILFTLLGFLVVFFEDYYLAISWAVLSFGLAFYFGFYKAEKLKREARL